MVNIWGFNLSFGIKAGVTMFSTNFNGFELESGGVSTDAAFGPGQSRTFPNIGVGSNQAGAVFAANNFKRANEGIYVFRRKFPFKMLKAKLPDVLRHAAFKPVGFYRVWQAHLYG